MNTPKYILSRMIEVVSEEDSGCYHVFSYRTGKLQSITAQLYEDLQRKLQLGSEHGVFCQPEYAEMINNEILVPVEQDENLELIHRRQLADECQTSYYEVILPNGMCNMNCDYCGQEHTQISLSDAQCNCEINRIRTILEKKNLNSLTIGWFGGEPLLTLNIIRKMTIDFIKICRELNMCFNSQIATNGLLLSESVIKELVCVLGISMIEVTLDGTKAVHNGRRRLKSGGENFDRIMRNIKNAIRLKSSEAFDFRIRCNVDSRNIDSAKNLILYLAEQELSKSVSLYFVPVYRWGEASGQEAELGKESWAEIEIEFLELLLNYGFNCNILPKVRHRGCVHTRLLATVVGPNGYLYSCTEIPLVPMYHNEVDFSASSCPPAAHNWIIGDIKHDGVPLKKSWYEELRQSGWRCTKCKYYGICNAGCPKKVCEGTLICPPWGNVMGKRIQLATTMQKQNIQTDLEPFEAFKR